MVSPNLPPDQAANALLPRLLKDGLSREGHEVRLMAFEPRGGADRDPAVHYVRRPSNGWLRKLKLSQMETGLSVLRQAGAFLEGADVLHVHSNAFMNQVASALAHRRGIPFVLTHYGTEIWHYQKRSLDPFLWMNRRAAHVTYYSRLLRDRSMELGVTPNRHVVIYPPVDDRFRPTDPSEREAARRHLRVEGPLLLNVKRLHPLAGQRFLVEAMLDVRETFPSAKLFIAGEGESRGELEALVADLDLKESVTLLGLVDNRELPRYYQAADLFVLPSKLEAFPTVAAEALASGVRVVSADHPGGIELKELFPEDVTLVPREAVGPLARAIIEALDRAEPSSEASRARIDREFRPGVAVRAYYELYRQAVDAGD